MGVSKGFLVLVPVLHITVCENVIGHMDALVGKDDKVLYGALILRQEDSIPLPLLVHSDLKGHARAILIPHVGGIIFKAPLKVGHKLLGVPDAKVHMGSPKVIVIVHSAKVLKLLRHKETSSSYKECWR